MSQEGSVLIFESHLTPWDACLNLNFDNERLSTDFVAACTRDHLTPMTTPTQGVPFDFVLSRARELTQRLIDAHTYFCRSQDRLLEQEPTTWVEVKGVVRAEATLGYQHRSLASLRLDPSHPDNTPLREAAALVRERSGEAALMLALSDFRSARREPGSYWAFHAFRVLEDIRDAFPGEHRSQRWDAMNAALGTTQDTWSELTDASTRSRHYNPANLVWLGDAARYGRLLTQVRDAIGGFIEHLSRSGATR
jgi:hypothetical protein